jgi:S-adenosylhomocysteine hydrolase
LDPISPRSERIRRLWITTDPEPDRPIELLRPGTDVLQAALRKRRVSDADGSFAWMVRATAALNPKPIEARAPVRVDVLLKAEDRRAVLALAKGPMRNYSAGEIARYCADLEERSERRGEGPLHRWTPAYIERIAGKELAALERPTDRYGDEPHFLFAVQLANYMMSLSVGTTEAKAIEGFMRNKRIGASNAWHTFEPSDVERLRRIYPFIPKWPDGTKSDACLSYSPGPAAPADSPALRELKARIKALAKIGLHDDNLLGYVRCRAEYDRMKDVKLVECTGIFADLIPRLDLMISIDGLRGKDVEIIAKHYSSDPLVADLVRRVFGAKIDIVDGDNAAVLDHSQRAVAGAIAAAKPGKTRVVAHIEGVKQFWSWFAEQQRKQPELSLVGVSHTTSDGRELLDSIGPPAGVVELMSLSEAKAKDERDRFKHTFSKLLDDVGYALNEPIYHRHYLVMGYGRIIGPAFVDALKSKGIEDFVIYDSDPERRRAARELGLKVVDDLSLEYLRSPFVVGCTGDRPLPAEELAKFRGTPTLLSLGSGRSEFDMEYLEQNAELRHQVGDLGHQPIVEYELENATFTAIADGYVANLAYAAPTIPFYSMTTPMLVWESIRQGLWHDERGRDGVHLLRAIDIDLDESGQRVIKLFPRDIEAMTEPAGEHKYFVHDWDRRAQHPFQFLVAEER